ncbi:MAG: hypothetical protein ABGW97_15690 [Christiangramia sp.]|uniref:TlpA family protein disulfide reductase n=1 Tax=Christiangramia sp. TaxID=1931228 RepID=UPI003242DA88
MKYAWLLIGFLLLLSGCNNQPEGDQHVFVGGQINNPETDYVVLSKEDSIIDTLYLNQQNQFGKEYDDLESGIYTFKHSPENQIMYLEPGDSVVIWLNTLDFDRSLNFSGDGAEKSNFLLDIFIRNLDNNDLILQYYKIKPERFAEITDSIRDDRMQSLERLEEQEELSDTYLKLAKASVNYEFYDLRERYSFLIHKYYPALSAEIPENFNNYREHINFSDEDLEDLYVYTNFLDDYLRSKSIEDCQTKECYNLNSLQNLSKRIELTDSLFKNDKLKHKFIDRFATQSIIMSETDRGIDFVLNLLKSIDYARLDYIERLSRMQRSYLKGNSIADKGLIDTNGNKTTYGEIIDKPSIIMSWSIYALDHHQWLHKIVKDLREKYPEIDFYTVNIDGQTYENWLRVLETFGYDKKYEYQIANRNIGNDMYKNYLTKVLFVDRKGVIQKGDISYSSIKDFEEDILEFLNK